MGLRDVTDRNAVLAAIDEFDALGRDAFLSKYGFGPARKYFVTHTNHDYDSKALLGAAHGFQHGRPLGPGEFSGGDATVVPVMERLGFTVRRLLESEVPNSMTRLPVAATEWAAGSDDKLRVLSRPFPGVTFVASEVNTALEYETTPAMGTTALRVEAGLVQRFETHLESIGHRVCRARIVVPEESVSLVTDTLDVTDNVLYEAKAAADRSTVRLAVGQLMDYLRFMPGTSGAVLLPSRPSDDLVSFIHSAGFDVTYEADPDFVVLPMPGL
jgi:hypothetical protein